MKARQISKVIGEKVAELAKAHPEISGVLLKNFADRRKNAD